MSENNVKSGFPASMGFPATTGFPQQGGQLSSKGFPAMDLADASAAAEASDGAKEGNIPKNVKYFDGITKLNKTDTSNSWKEFGGERLATYEPDGSAYITRIIERESKKSGVYFKVVERLTKDADGYGVIAWRIDLGAVARRKPTKQKFEDSWHDAILLKVKAVVADGEGVASAARKLADELGVSFSTMRANLWVADKWSRGEMTTFLPHRSMIKSIFGLLCDLGKREETLASMEAYCKAVSKPSEFVLEIMRENGKA